MKILEFLHFWRENQLDFLRIAIVISILLQLWLNTNALILLLIQISQNELISVMPFS